MALEPVAKSIGPGYAFAIYGHLLVQLWQSSATLEAAQALRRFTRDWAGQTELILAIVERLDQLPTEAAREELAAMTSELRSPVSLIVFDGAGFKAAALRAVVTGIFALSGHRHTMKVFSTLQEAIHWGREHSTHMPVLSDLEPQIAFLRSALKQPATPSLVDR